MYPNLYYVFSDLFGIEISFLKLINSFGFFVAMAFVTAGFLLKKEFTRLTNEGIFSPTKTQILVGEKASTSSIISQSAIGFIFGWKFLYLAINANELFQGGILPQTFLFSLDGSVLLGILGAISMGGLHWWDSKKNELSKPQLKDVDVHPSEHIGSILTVAAVGGILGAKLFHLIEYPDQFVAFIKAPSLNAFLGGLTIYGGLIVGGISVWLYTRHLGLSFLNVADTAAPSLMLGYGVGRIGCQVSGDGDWGIDAEATSLCQSHVTKTFNKYESMSFRNQILWGFGFSDVRKDSSKIAEALFHMFHERVVCLLFKCCCLLVSLPSYALSCYSMRSK